MISKAGKLSLLEKFWAGIRGAVLFSTSSTVGQLILMVYSLLVARWLGPDSFGIISACYAVASISVILISWGMDTWLLRNGSLVDDSSEYTGRILSIKLFFSFIWGPALWLVFTRIRPDVYVPDIFILSILDVGIENGFATIIATYTVKSRTRLASLLIVSSRSLRLLSALILIFLEIKDIQPFVFLRLCFTIIIFIIGLITLRPKFYKPTRVNIRNIVGESLPFGTSEFLATIYGQIDVVMISLMAPRIYVGLYSPAISIINAAVTALSSSYQYFIPRFTRIVFDQRKDLIRLTKYLAAGYLVVGIFLWLGFGILGESIVDIVLGDNYQVTGKLVKLLSPLLFFKSLSMFCAVILVSVGWQRKRIVPQIISASVNIGLNLWMIPNFGVTGAAMVYVTSEAVLLAGYGYWVFRFFKTAYQREA